MSGLFHLDARGNRPPPRGMIKRICRYWSMPCGRGRVAPGCELVFWSHGSYHSMHAGKAQ